MPEPVSEYRGPQQASAGPSCMTEYVPGRRYKVCIASMAPFVGGAEVAAERLAIGLRNDGHDVFLVLGQQNAVMERMQRAGLRCIYSPMYLTNKRHWWRYLRARHALRRILSQERPDVLHSNDFPTHQMVSGAARGLGVPRICHHRFPYEETSIRWLNKYGAEFHMFVSRALMEGLCSCSGQLQRSPKAVVYDGLPMPAKPEEAERRKARAQLGLPAGQVIVTFTGQVIERKGVADLIHAWRFLDEETRGQATLVIVGDDLRGRGAYRTEMERLAKETDCPAIFAGFQKNMGEWLLASDFVVVPSHVEPLGNATLEAMSYALPVIGSSVGGIPEMIKHEVTGLLVPPESPARLAEAIRLLVRDAGKRLRYGDESRQRCNKLFSLEAHVRSVVREYDGLKHPEPRSAVA